MIMRSNPYIQTKEEKKEHHKDPQEFLTKMVPYHLIFFLLTYNLVSLPGPTTLALFFITVESNFFIKK